MITLDTMTIEPREAWEKVEINRNARLPGWFQVVNRGDHPVCLRFPDDHGPVTTLKPGYLFEFFPE